MSTRVISIRPRKSMRVDPTLTLRPFRPLTVPTKWANMVMRRHGFVMTVQDFGEYAQEGRINQVRRTAINAGLGLDEARADDTAARGYLLALLDQEDLEELGVDLADWVSQPELDEGEDAQEGPQDVQEAPQVGEGSDDPSDDAQEAILEFQALVEAEDTKELRAWFRDAGQPVPRTNAELMAQARTFLDGMLEGDEEE